MVRVVRVLGLATAWLAAPSVLPAAEEGAKIFSLNFGLVLWTWVLFLATLALLAWKAFPAIEKGLVSRRDRIQEAIDAARKDRDEARALLDEHREQLDEARREAQQILAEGRSAGERLREDILAKARGENEAMLVRARRDLERDRADMLESIRREAVDLALAAAERLVRARLDDETSRRLVREYVAELE